MPPRKLMRDVIVCLPGITGSVLQKNGKDVWNISGGAVLNALETLGHSIDDLMLHDDSPTVEDLGDGVTAPEVIRDVHLIPGLWKIDGYTKLVEHITSTFDVTRGQNLFEFPYDWRRDNRVAAHRLARQSADWLAKWRASSGAQDAKLVLVGHSMGGLISRYFLECLEGWRDTRVLLTFGTPYRGSLNAVDTLANGHKLLFFDLSRLARSFTAVYQLLPVYPCYDAGDGNLVRVSEAEVPNIDAAKAQAALDFHHEIRDAVANNMKEGEYVQNRYDIRPVIGITQPTAQSALRHGDAVQLLNRHGDEDLGGDGTVPRVSATPLEVEHEENAMYASERHASLQNDDHVLLQLTGVVSGIPIDHNQYRGAVPTIGLALDVEDVYPAGEPIRVRVRPEGQTAGELVVRVADVATDAEVTRAVANTVSDGWSRAEIGPLPEGAYRVTAMGGGPVEPVTDVVTVLRAFA
jgi:pimeloyl-ACP methyl ester carboxylesterase